MSVDAVESERQEERNARMRGNCVVCDEPVNVRSAGWYRQVTGWEQVGKTGTIALREPTGQVMHFACMDKKGMVPGQGTMFE